MAVAKQATVQAGFTSSDKARFLLRPAQKTDQLCKNPKPCSYGDRCIFAHNMEEQKRFRQAFGTGGASAPAAKAAQQGAAGGAKAGQQAAPAQQKTFYCHPAKFKTMLCHNFQRQGYCIRGTNCSFAHGESELPSGGSAAQPSGDAAQAFSPAPPPPPPAHAPSSSASTTGDAPAQSGSAGAGSGSGSQPEVQDGIAAEELDEAYALQLQYDEQRSYKEKVEQAQREWEGEGGPEAAAPESEAQPPPRGSYAATAVAAAPPAAAPAVMQPPPGLSLPRLDSEAAFPSLQAVGGKGVARPAAGGSRPHSRAPSSGGCSAAGGSGPITACPSEEGAQRSPTSCDGSVVAEAELAAHPTDEQLTGAEGGGATEEQGQAPGEEQQGSLGCGAGGEETAAAGGPSLVRQAGSRGSWADAEDEEAEEAQQPAVPVQAPLLPPPPPPPCQPEQHAAPPAQALLQALRAASAASAGAPMPSSGSPSQQRPPPSFVAGLPFAPGAAPAPLRAPLQPGTAPAANAGAAVDLSLIPHFVCPLTSRPFAEPVVAADGVTYERDVIEFLLYRKNIEHSPVVRGVRLEHNGLVPNTALRCAMGEVAALLASMAGP